jgi:hypothetical protein
LGFEVVFGPSQERARLVQTQSIANYFNDISLYSWSNGRWLNLYNKGSVSNYNGGMDSVAVDAGERRLLTDSPLPLSCTVVRLGGAGAAVYAVGYRPDDIHSSRGNEPFAYVIHKTHDAAEVWRGVKVMAASGTASGVTWTKMQDTWSNPAYHDSADNRILPDVVFIGYSLVLPSDCVATVDDEIRMKKSIYVIKSMHDLNDIRIALSHRKETPT